MIKNLREILSFLVVIMLCSTPVQVQAAAESQLPSPNLDVNQKVLIDEILDKSGLKASIRMLPDQIVKGMLSQHKDNMASIDDMEKLLRADFTSQGFESRIVSAIANNYDEKRLRSYLSIMTLPLSMRMNVIELAAPDSQQVSAYAGELVSNPLSSKRVEFLVQLDSISGTSKLYADVLTAILRSFSIAAEGAFDASKVEYINRQMDLERDKILGNVKKEVLFEMAFTYREVSDGDLEEYIRNLKSDDVKWFTGIVQTAFKDEIDYDGLRYAKQYIELVKATAAARKSSEKKSASGLNQNSSTGNADDAALSKAIIGSWTCDPKDTECGGSQSITTYQADGSAEFVAYFPDGNCSVEQAKVNGSWFIKNRKLILIVAESWGGFPLHKGDKTTDDIISILPTTMVLINSDGHKEFRLRGKACLH